MSITIANADPFEQQVARRAGIATEKQLAFLDRLLPERDLTACLPWVAACAADYRSGATLGRQQVSGLIDALLNAPRTSAPRATDKGVSSVDLTPGMYMLGTRIFKVQRSQTGHLYAKELIDSHFTYAAGATRLIHADDRMTLDQAKTYGANTGTCCVCGRELTAEESIEAGIGPTCAGRL